MVYDYFCKTCDKVVEVNKLAKDSSREEKCPECKKPMDRVFGVSMIRTGDGLK